MGLSTSTPILSLPVHLGLRACSRTSRSVRLSPQSGWSFCDFTSLSTRVALCWHKRCLTAIASSLASPSRSPGIPTRQPVRERHLISTHGRLPTRLACPLPLLFVFISTTRPLRPPRSLFIFACLHQQRVCAPGGPFSLASVAILGAARLCCISLLHLSLAHPPKHGSWLARSVPPPAASGLISLRRRCILSCCPPAFRRHLGFLCLGHPSESFCTSVRPPIPRRQASTPLDHTLSYPTPARFFLDAFLDRCFFAAD